MSEEELKNKGEKLAKLAVDSQLAAKQLRSLYTLVKTRPLPFVEAYVKRQITRVSGAEALEMVLNLLIEYRDDKSALIRLLMYTNMLYDFIERQSFEESISLVERSAQKVCEQKRCKCLRVNPPNAQGSSFEVCVSGYYGDFKDLSMLIKKEIISCNPSFDCKIWIASVDRR